MTDLKNALKYYGKDHCQPELISRFLDKELSIKDEELVKAHLDLCPVCRSIAKDMIEMADQIKAGIRAETENVDFSKINQAVLSRIRLEKTEKPSFLSHVIDFFSNSVDFIMGEIRSSRRRTLIPASALLASIAFILIITATTGIFSPENVPSALVSSVSSDVSSVFIMETTGTKQTIIWIGDPL
jgi:anti-sigma factor RsiW